MVLSTPLNHQLSHFSFKGGRYSRSICTIPPQHPNARGWDFHQLGPRALLSQAKRLDNCIYNTIVVRPEACRKLCSLQFPALRMASSRTFYPPKPKRCWLAVLHQLLERCLFLKRNRKADLTGDVTSGAVPADDDGRRGDLGLIVKLA